MSETQYKNILVVGERQVGKTLLINSLAKYVCGENLGPPQCSNDTCSVYSIRYYDCEYRLIDSNGVDEGSDGTQQLLEFIYSNQLQEIHAVAIVVKSNQARLTMQFKNSMIKLLGNFHRSAVDNMLFIFTYAAANNYSTQSTTPVLNAILTNNIRAGLHLATKLDNSNNMYCFENRHCLMSSDDQTLQQSWIKSSNESIRLLEHVSQLQPHQLRDSIQFNKIKRILPITTQHIKDIQDDVDMRLLDPIKQMIIKHNRETKRMKKEVLVMIAIVDPLMTYVLSNCITDQTLEQIGKYQNRMWINRGGQRTSNFQVTDEFEMYESSVRELCQLKRFGFRLQTALKHDGITIPPITKPKLEKNNFGCLCIPTAALEESYRKVVDTHFHSIK